MAVDLAAKSPVLKRGDDGIWRTETGAAHALSYPSTGNSACFRIEDGSFWFAHRSACIAAALARQNPRGPLIDVGGGNGAVSRALESAGYATVLLEPGPEGARNAQIRGLENVVCATLEEARFADGTFGIAGAFDVIEHIADEEPLLREMYRVLRPAGALCVTVPAYAWLWSTEDDLAGHYRRYTRSRLEAVLERCGFDVVYATYFFAPLIAPLFFARSLPHRFRRRDANAVDEASAKQHETSPLARRAVDAVLAPELARVRAGKPIPLGTSCLAVARKRP